MAETRIDASTASDLTNAVKDYQVQTETIDGVSEVGKTRWFNNDWNQNLGYYKIPEVTSVTDAKASWTVGKGFKADELTTMLLDSIKGWGKDTWNSIMEDMVRVMEINGDAYCHIIKNDEGNLINLKPLPPEAMVHVVGDDGMIESYEQVSKIKGKKPKVYQPEEIFHLVRNRLADEIHGQSQVKILADIILMKNEAMTDWKRVLHRNIDPLWIFHLDTDDTTEIAAFKTKVDNARGKGENMYIPKDIVVPEMVGVAPNANLNPMSWLEYLDNRFYEAARVPKIIVGGAGGLTEAAVKIAYLAFQQNTEEGQLFLEEQILAQLNLVVEFEFPVSIENELLSDKEKDGPVNIDASETTAGESK